MLQFPDVEKCRPVWVLQDPYLVNRLPKRAEFPPGPRLRVTRTRLACAQSRLEIYTGERK